MKQDDELWMKKMKEMLQNYEEPAPPGGWDKLSQSLLPPVQHRIIPRKWWGVAAAVLILAVSGISFFFLHTPVAEDVRLTETPEITPDVVPDIPQPETIAQRIMPAKEIRASRNVAQIDLKDRIKPDKKEETLDTVEKPKQLEHPEDNKPVENQVKSNNAAKSIPDTKQERNNSVKKTGTKPYNPVVTNQKEPKRWTMGVSVNSGTASLLNNDHSAPLSVDRTSMLSAAELASTATNSTGYVDLSDKELVYKEGMLQVAEYDDIDHQLPVTVGLSLRKDIGNGFSLETGVTYTFLKSDITKHSSQGKTKGEQKLHYIGIPVRANWDFIRNRNFTVYLSAGGTIEKCVYGKTLDEKVSEKPLQFSLNAGVGAQYNINKQVGLYVEPGVSYFFDDRSKIETIRKKDPFNFNLQAGVRFSY